MIKQLFFLINREVVIGWRQQQDVVVASAFFLVAIFVFAITLSTDQLLLSQTAIPIIWVLLLLTNFMPLDHLWADDWRDGTLEQLLSCGITGWQLALIKALRHFLVMMPTIFLATALAAILLDMSFGQWERVLLSLLLSFPSLSLLTVMGAALTVRAVRQQLILPIILLPLMIPVLLFGVGLSYPMPVGGGGTYNNLMLLAALFLFFLILCPWVSGWVIHQG